MQQQVQHTGSVQLMPIPGRQPVATSMQSITVVEQAEVGLRAARSGHSSDMRSGCAAA
jgi:hypothetical protein